ncbi:hypothetical protein CHS0354_009329 [Potamilus streckersoni]|uniref:Transmembrane protein n=1 Tax=Potamilus streckersoni TaxID=2493646 RepID=A0AAE0VY44_9BIVA|nr:hypothetical protein CHS0354_009329 [Potamilus streckersoni]
MRVSEQNTLSKRQCNEKTPLLWTGGLTGNLIAHDTVRRRMCICRRSFLLGLLVGVPVAVFTFTTYYTTSIVVKWIICIADTIFICSLLISCVIGLVRSLRKRDERDVQQFVSFGAETSEGTYITASSQRPEPKRCSFLNMEDEYVFVSPQMTRLS